MSTRRNMNGNIANGGLAVKWRGTVIFAKPNEWFMNVDDEYIYYSDRGNKNRLYRKRGLNDEGKLLLKEPCSYVTLYEDGLFYINEEQMKIYRCSKEGRGRTQCSDTGAAEFGILDGGGVYINPCAKRLCVYGQSACYADSSNNFALTVANVDKRDEPKVYSDIKPSHINVHDGNIYYTDRMRENTLYRLDSFGNRLSIFGGSAECLHIIDDWLFFISGRKWRRLSLINYGEAEEV